MHARLSIDRHSKSRRNRFTSVRLDRLVERRDDAEWVRAAMHSEKARFVPLWRSRSLIDASGEGHIAVYLKPGELDDVETVQPPTLLGTDGKRYFFVVSINDQQREQLKARHPEADFVDLRRASVNMDAKHAGVLAYAKALHYWQYRQSFCGICGSSTVLQSSGHKLACSNDECAREFFPRIDPAIIVLVTCGDACLLGRNVRWPPRRFSTLAGFVEPGESLEDAVVREVQEEAGVTLSRIEYVSSQPWPFPASAMCGFFAEAVSTECATSDELEELRWFTVAELVEAVSSGEILLSPSVSIAFRLLADWFEKNGGGDLEALAREVAREKPL
jgi:NAD+ diphosphatase